MSIDEKIHFFETSELLFKAILPDEDNYLFFDYRFKEIYLELAELWCEKSNKQKAIDYLLLAEKCANRYDSFIKNNKAKKFESIFLNRCTVDPKEFSRNYIGTEKEHLLRNINNKVFDIIRNSSEFIDLHNRLNA